MRIRPDSLADRGMWISDDRVYALVTGVGVAEIGYHGLQPVSKNSRVFVHQRAALTCFVDQGDGERRPIVFDEFDWNPDGVLAEHRLERRTIQIDVRLCGRTLKIGFSARGGDLPSIVLRCTAAALWTDVQGEREWNSGKVSAGVLHLSFRDRIMLNRWINREGPYKGDFLIPEAWRRVLFRRACRSGEATPDDLHPQYRDAAIPLYDTTTHVLLGGKEFTCTVDDQGFEFASVPRASAGGPLEFDVRFDDAPPGISSDVHVDDSGDDLRASRPHLVLPEHPHLEAFYRSLPELVRSCVIGDYGVPRATPGRYYWIWAWDLMVTALEMLHWGDLEGARRAARFVSTHRDVDGRIPGRWTRSLEPLDTPEEGAGLEFLLAHLSYELYLESGSLQDILDIYPTLVGRFRAILSVATSDGTIPGKGFYPDLPGRFGRSAHTATAIESGCWYGLSRILQNMALLIGDEALAMEAGGAADRSGDSFTETFWDPQAGMLQDAVDRQTGKGTGRHPIFSLLCLQSPLSAPILESHLGEIARFCDEQLFTEHGLRTVPLAERGDGAEVILDAWYPHWDLYMLRLLRRTGNRAALLRWLALAERTLSHLGYCPEFLALEGFREGNPAAWTHHGSPSNLNCATAWYRALLEVLFGLELDPGGLTITESLCLDGRISLRGLRLRQAHWNLELFEGGPSLVRCIVDGTDLGGCRKIPRTHSGPGVHNVEMHYGVPAGGIVLEGLLNGEVLRIIQAGPLHLHLHIRTLGPGALHVRAPAPVSIRLNGQEIRAQRDPNGTTTRASLHHCGEGELEVTLAAERS